MDVHLIPAVELSASVAGQPMDILGYGIDPRHPPLLAALDEMVRRRKERIAAMIERLNAQGVALDQEEVFVHARRRRRRPAAYRSGLGRTGICGQRRRGL